MDWQSLVLDRKTTNQDSDIPPRRYHNRTQASIYYDSDPTFEVCSSIHSSLLTRSIWNNWPGRKCAGMDGVDMIVAIWICDTSQKIIAS